MQLSEPPKPSHSDKNTEENLPKAISEMTNLSPSSHNDPSSQGLLSVLTNPQFLILWIGQVFSQLADKIYIVLIIALIAGHFQSEGQPISGWVSAVMIAFTIPAVLFGSLGGVYVDRWQKKQVLVISNLLRGIFVIIIPPVLWICQQRMVSIPVNWLPIGWRHWQAHPHDFFDLPLGFIVLIILTFVDSTLTQFFAPAEQATIPLIVNRRHLLSANSLFTTTMMGTLILGFAIGEPVLQWAASFFNSIGLPWDLGKSSVVAGCYIIAGVILMLLRTYEKPEDHQIERPHILEDVKDSIRYLKKNRRVRNALLQLVILFSVFAALSVLAVRLAETIPSMKAEQFGFLLASGGLGLAIGAGILGHWGQEFAHSKLSLWGSIGMALSLVGLSLSTQSLLLSVLMTTFLGFFGSLIGVPMQTTIQEETPPDMLGKVFGLQNNAVNIALTLPLALAGIAETLFGLQPVFIGLAVLALLGGGLTWYVTGVNKIS